MKIKSKATYKTSCKLALIIGENARCKAAVRAFERAFTIYREVDRQEIFIP